MDYELAVGLLGDEKKKAVESTFDADTVRDMLSNAFNCSDPVGAAMVSQRICNVKVTEIEE